MNRQEKSAEIDGLKERFAQSQLTIIALNKGLTVAAVTDLRRKLREKSGSLKVVKNRLAKIAIKGTLAEPLTEYFKSTATIVTSGKDLTGPAKVLAEFSKGNEKIEIKVGLLGGKVISEKDVKALADMPSKEELIAKMLGSFKAPATNLVSVLVQIPRQWVQVLSAVRDQKEKGV